MTVVLSLYYIFEDNFGQLIFDSSILKSILKSIIFKHYLKKHSSSKKPITVYLLKNLKFTYNFTSQNC